MDFMAQRQTAQTTESHSANSGACEAVFTVVKAHLLDQLRGIFESFEQTLLESSELTPVCCSLRRSRRQFIDGYLRQLWLRCEHPESEWVVGNATSAMHARTFIYLSAADLAVRDIYQQQEESTGRLAAVWSQHLNTSCTVFSCPVAPHTLARLFFLFLPDLPAPLRIRDGLARQFVTALPQLSKAINGAVFNFLQRKGMLVASIAPQPMPQWWEPLGKVRSPSAAAQTLVIPPRSVEKMLQLAVDIAHSAQQADYAAILQGLSGQRQTALLPWLAEQLAAESSLLPPARKTLALLAGPLLYAAQDEVFADNAHPARLVLDAWLEWGLGWQWNEWDGVVSENCMELAASLADRLLQQPESLMSGWMEMLDYLLSLRKRVQQDSSAVVASTRLSLQVVEVRAEVDALLRARTSEVAWPPVVVEILHGPWQSLLLGIFWREGTASDTWLNTLSVAQELLASVQLDLDSSTRQQLMQRVPHLLKSLRHGFDVIGVDWRVYSALLDRLERVHLGLLQVDAAVEPVGEARYFWPEPASMPAEGEPFEVGCWLQQDGHRWHVVFSDALCTVLLDTQTAGQTVCATASLQAEFYDGDVAVLPALPALLPMIA
jgi:hypothetical protein